MTTYHPRQTKLAKEARKRREHRAVVLNVDNVCAAIEKHRGVLNEIAMDFGIARFHIDKFIVSCPRALETLKSAREALGDLAEQRLYELIDAGDRASILFYLSTKCRNRGYVMPKNGESDGEGGSKNLFVHTIQIIGVGSNGSENGSSYPAGPMIEHRADETAATEPTDNDGTAEAGADGPGDAAADVGDAGGEPHADAPGVGVDPPAATEAEAEVVAEEEHDLFS